MLKAEKERIVAELTERLRACESLIVADYRGLSNAELATLRGKLREQGVRFTVVKNTLTRRAADAVGADALLALLEGPTAIAFVEADGDPAAVAKALADAAKETKVLTLRGGVLSGQPLSAEDVASLAALPPLDVLKGQLVGVIVAPLTQFVGVLAAPLRDLVGLIDARITQLTEQGDTSASAPPAAEPEQPAPEPAEAPALDEPTAEASAGEPVAEAPADEPVAEAPADEPVAQAATESDTTEDTSEEE